MTFLLASRVILILIDIVAGVIFVGIATARVISTTIICRLISIVLFVHGLLELLINLVSMATTFSKLTSESLHLLVLTIAHFLGLILLDQLLELFHALFGLLDL